MKSVFEADYIFATAAMGYFEGVFGSTGFALGSKYLKVSQGSLQGLCISPDAFKLYLHMKIQEDSHLRPIVDNTRKFLESNDVLDIELIRRQESLCFLYVDDILIFSSSSLIKNWLEDEAT